MRFFLLAAAVSISIATATFACSSSSPPAAAEEDAGTSIPNAPPPSEDEEEDSGGAEIILPDSGTKSDAGDGGDPGTTEGDAGARCEADSIRESEANNDANSADTLPWKTGSICGRLSGDDVDFFTFTIPDSENGFRFSTGRTPNNGRYRIDCSVDGRDFRFNDDYPYVLNKPYVCKVALTGDEPVDYRVDLNVRSN